ncbi:hypothetical protein Vadar_000230 [Vaccinium darrowii]|uniref:Uncharacterized protein n=1 Tax=Vaccinium darrowii TaxID=229202 RepID=A0ACB7X6V6_9ERIC|nr:hypothetical protein Vadar_000230 [Vaccinium darrowii]
MGVEEEEDDSNAFINDDDEMNDVQVLDDELLDEDDVTLYYAKMSTRGRGRGGHGTTGRRMTPQGVTTTSVLTPDVQSTLNNPEHNSSAAPHIFESVQASKPLTREDAPVTKGCGRTKGLALAKFRGRGEKEKSWEEVSQDAKEMFIAHIREEFDLPEAPYVNRAILRAMGRRYCDNRSHLKKKFDRGIVNCPEHIEEADWTYLYNLWENTVYVGKCNKYKASRSKPRIHHVAGSKPFYKVKNDMVCPL